MLRPRGVRHSVDRLARLARGIARNPALVAAVSDVEQGQRGVHAAVASFEVAVLEVSEVAARIDARAAALDADLRELRSERDADRTELMLLRARLEMVLREARRALPGSLDEGQLERLARTLDASHNDLYEDFENRFRGSRDIVKELLKVYLPDVASLRGGSAPVLDIGCGRGEWLELLQEDDVPGYGVDINDRFVKANADRGLDARHGDAVAHLRELPESSLGAVTAFHVIEHLSLDAMVELVDAALRALRPGGLLVCETPNSTNLRVGASSFYLDPTHLKPLHPHFLEFLLTSRGFVDVDVRFLHAQDEQALAVPDAPGARAAEMTRLVSTINWALFGPLDYAVVGIKAIPR